jgi:hypothetical protein
MSYASFIERKSQIANNFGFEPTYLPSCLFDFQRHLAEWSVRKGRSLNGSDCGMGKTLVQLVWAENVRRHTGKSVLILTPLAVSSQTIREAHKFNIDATRSQDGTHAGGIVVTNYERLHHFSPEDFIGCVCDESSILKSFSGHRRKQITRFIAKMPYRLLCTATAAPNDYVELGNSSEALGELSYSEMIKRFFKMLDDKGQKSEQRLQDEAEKIIGADPNYYKKLAYRVAQTIGQWRLKHHAVRPFWRWVASWARVCRKPSDLGFADGAFVLPSLNEIEHQLKPDTPPPGMLFNIAAFGMAAEREERRRTIAERCAYVASLVNHDRPAVVWCHLNEEGKALAKAIPGAEEIAGSTEDDRKEAIYDAFATGNLRVLVIKPKIGAFGLNWQHCNHVVTFPSHSYEQYYQSVRRCWRFGQKAAVRVDVVATDGECRVMGNMRQKADKANRMFDELIREMNNAVRVERPDNATTSTEIPSWLC